MIHNNTHYSGNALDWTIAQALEGNTVEAQLHQLRAKFEPDLADAHERVNAQRTNIENLRKSAQLQQTKKYNTDVSIDDLWILAQIIFPHVRQTLDRAEHALTAFALRHGLARRPITPNQSENMLLLALFIVIETMLNAGFLNNAHMVAGPLQAMMAAALISLTNVTVCSAGGYFIGRWFIYGLYAADPDEVNFKWRRDIAYALMIVFVCVIAFFHLTIGLIRSQETLHSVNHSFASYFEILTTPEALFLVLIGSVMSCISWKKGVSSFDDPYPGYGERQRSVDDIRKQLQATFEDVYEQLCERFDDKYDELENAEKSAFKEQGSYNKAIEDYFRFQRLLDNQIRQAESELQANVAQIVHHHRAARGLNNAAIPDNALERLIQFDDYRIHGSPTFLTPVYLSAQKTVLLTAKTEALQRLTALFKPISCHDTGEQ